MTSGMIAAAVGILLVAYQAFLPPLAWLLFGTALCGYLYRRYRKPFWLLASCLCAGIAWGSAYGLLLQGHLLPEQLERENLWVEGVVTGLPETREMFGKPQHRFQFKVTGAGCLDPQPDCSLSLRKLRLTQYGGEAPTVGERWHYSVRLRRPRGFANPAGFDYGRWLVGQGVHASGYVTGEQPARRLSPASAWWSWRARLRDHLRQQLGGLDHADILMALMVGDRSGLSSERWQRYQRTGTTHLIAISGLHIGIVAACGLLLGRALLRCLALIGWRWPSAYLWPALLAAGVYSYLAGYGLPTQRALLMCALALMGLALKRKLSLWWLWSAALLAVAIVNPLTAYSGGFWLSFGAVAVLILALGGRAGGRRQLSWRPQLAIFLGLMPVLAAVTGQFSGLALPANLVAVPLFSLLLVPLNFLALLLLPVSETLALVLWSLCDRLLGHLERFLSVLSSQDWAFWQLPGPLPAYTLLLAAAGMLVLLLPRGWPGKRLAPLLLLPLLLWRPPALASAGDFRVTVLDVGQGLAVVVQTRQHSLVYDLGPRFSERFSTAEAVVLPYLHAQALAELDTLVISHGDNDHAGDTPAFLSEMPTRRILVGEALRGVDGAEPCRAGERWQWDAVDFAILHPSVEGKYQRSNNRSCVLRISGGGHTVLLTGDIERRVEQTLLATLREEESTGITLLLAPHHGSATSSSTAFVQALAPEHVVFSAGYKHHFGHPRPAVVNRYQRNGSLAWNTALDGALQFELQAGRAAAVSAWRHNHHLYWQTGRAARLP